MLEDALVEFEARLEEAGVRTVVHLRAGLPPPEVVRRLTAGLGRASDELATWFAWHDGLELPSSGAFTVLERHPFIAWRPLSLGAAVAEMRRWQHGAPHLVEPGWLPIGEQPDGQCHLFAQTSERARTVSLVTSHALEDARGHFASSLEAGVRSWLELMARDDVRDDARYDAGRWVFEDMATFPRDLLWRAGLAQSIGR